MAKIANKNNPYEIEAKDLIEDVLELFIEKRKDKEWTAKEMSEKLGKKSASHISQIENQKIDLSYNQFLDMASLLGGIPDKWVKQVKNKQDKFVYVKGGNLHASDGPRKVLRHNFDDDDLEYYSLLSNRNHLNKIATKFHVGLTCLKTKKTSCHYHRGDEMIIPLNGTLTLKYLSDESSKGNIVWDSYILTPETEKEFAWFKGWRPHYLSKESDDPVWFLQIYKDSRGESAIYDFLDDAAIREDYQAYTFDENKDKNKNIHAIVQGFGVRLRDIRMKSGMALNVLANQVEIHPSYLSRLEKNEANPPLKLVFAITIALDKPIDALFSSAEEPLIYAKLNELREKFAVPNSGRINVEIISEGNYEDCNKFTATKEDVAFFALSGIAKILVTNDSYKGRIVEEVQKIAPEHDIVRRYLEERDCIYIKRKMSYCIELKRGARILKVTNRKDRPIIQKIKNEEEE